MADGQHLVAIWFGPSKLVAQLQFQVTSGGIGLDDGGV